jgi:hypothetical protein
MKEDGSGHGDGGGSGQYTLGRPRDRARPTRSSEGDSTRSGPSRLEIGTWPPKGRDSARR